MQNLLKKFTGNANEQPEQTPVTDSSNNQSAHMGATEASASEHPELQIEKGSRVETEITEVTDTEVRSKFILQGIGTAGVGVTPREKFTVGNQIEVGDLATQEIESWEYRDGQLTAALRYIKRTQQALPNQHPLKDVEDDLVESIPGG
jgi:hypothetical protein